MTKEGYFATSIEPKAAETIKFTLYCGTLAHTPVLGELEVIPNAVTGVDAEGTIVFISAEMADKPLIALLEYDSSLTLDMVDIVTFDLDNENAFYFPGFIDTHIHAPQFSNLGIFGNKTLLEWLDYYTFPLESSFKDLDIAKSHYQKCVDRTLKNGTTCASYFATIHPLATNLLADIALQTGQRAFIGKVCMDNNSPDHYIETLEECRESNLKVIQHIEQRDPTNEFVAPIITPRFAGSCTSKTLQMLGDLRASKDYHCQTHINETKREIEWTLEQFPECSSYTDVYLKHNILSNKTILAHGIHFTEEERDIVAKIGCGISHCPTSNSSITSGEARIRWLLEAGLNISLGTDCSGGFSPSILTVAKHALLVSRHLVMGTGVEKEKLTVDECLYFGTMGGAKVCKLEDKVGSFTVGKKWDAQMVDLQARGSPVDCFTHQAPKWKDADRLKSLDRFQDIIDKWAFNGDDRNLVKVFVNGRCVVDNL